LVPSHLVKFLSLKRTAHREQASVSYPKTAKDKGRVCGIREGKRKTCPHTPTEQLPVEDSFHPTDRNIMPNIKT
jgi:hypothetical protein